MNRGVIAIVMFIAGFLVSGLISTVDIRQPAGTAEDIPSPSLWINKEDIHYDKDKVTINMPNLVVAEVDPTSNSMDPWIDNSFLIEKPVEDCSKLQVGDIITFPHEDKRIVHRVVGIENGVITTKGDNNPDIDPFTTTCNDVNKVVGILT